MQSISKMMLAIGAVLLTLGLGASQAFAQCDDVQNWTNGVGGSGSSGSTIQVKHPTESFSYFTFEVSRDAGYTPYYSFIDEGAYSGSYNKTALEFGSILHITPNQDASFWNFTLVHHNIGSIELSWDGGSTWYTYSPSVTPAQGDSYSIFVNPALYGQIFKAGNTVLMRGSGYETNLISLCTY